MLERYKYIFNIALEAVFLNKFRSILTALGIIFDPVNLIPPEGLPGSQADFFQEALDVFGDRIVAIHAKDFRLEGGCKSEALPAGSGELEYEKLFSLLAKRGVSPDVLLENTSPATAPDALAFLRAAAG